MAETYYYLTDYSDEINPCEPTLEGWANWLAAGDPDWGPGLEPAKDGDTFDCATLTIFAWQKYLTNSEGDWTPQGPVPEHDFAAIVADDQAIGWGPDEILWQSNVEEGLAEYSQLTSEDEGEAWVCFGRENKTPLVATFHADGPTVTVEEVRQNG